ncbi:DUF922 domain-containing Zn-dependent protease [Allorhizobium borbori]|uniref:Putative secreted Zn-dependent protease n=1 Tax=Allorhizobium borbori TaxID=485907 RepID=A0A7W6K2M6_9HYPH|nr:DUF922 domain-containing protein [Allorhizobium borbori]MBB4103962.1 putative secreted Zn-dependent protease [Allorhizobium borbori]
MPRLLLILFATLVSGAFAAAQAEWKAAEKIVTYPVSGTTGMALYQSIGENGPVIGNGVRAIAHTTFKLLWSRDYQPRGTACVLASARPSLTITYTLPKPSAALPPAMKAKWDMFLAGIRKHEAVHGQNIRDLVGEIERVSVGLTVENDPGCKKIRDDLQGRLKVLSDARLKKESDFDRLEMSPGGNVHQLILALVNE